MHALVDPGIASGFGVEIDRIKCDKAAAFLRQALVELRRKGVVRPGDNHLQEPPSIQCAPIEQVGVVAIHRWREICSGRAFCLCRRWEQG